MSQSEMDFLGAPADVILCLLSSTGSQSNGVVGSNPHHGSNLHHGSFGSRSQLDLSVNSQELSQLMKYDSQDVGQIAEALLNMATPPEGSSISQTLKHCSQPLKIDVNPMLSYPNPRKRALDEAYHRQQQQQQSHTINDDLDHVFHSPPKRTLMTLQLNAHHHQQQEQQQHHHHHHQQYEECDEPLNLSPVARCRTSSISSTLYDSDSLSSASLAGTGDEGQYSPPRKQRLSMVAEESFSRFEMSPLPQLDTAPPGGMFKFPGFYPPEHEKPTASGASAPSRATVVSVPKGGYASKPSEATLRKKLHTASPVKKKSPRKSNPVDYPLSRGKSPEILNFQDSYYNNNNNISNDDGHCDGDGDLSNVSAKRSVKKQLDFEEQIADKRERNRLAAQRLREKKRAEQDLIYDELVVQERRFGGLVSQVEYLEEEIQQYRDMLRKVLPSNQLNCIMAKMEEKEEQ